MEYKIIDCQPMNREFGADRGTDGVPGYDFQILHDSEKYCLNISASRNFLSNRITKKEDYEKFCREVIKQGMSRSHFNKIKERWIKNSKNCFTLVVRLNKSTNQAKISYGATWDMEDRDAWLTGLIQIK